MRDRKAEFRARKADPAKYERLKETSRAWKAQHLAEHARLAREYRRRHPEKIVAQNRLNYAVRIGKVVRQPCEMCGTPDRVHAHHVSYEPKDWLNVRWLCFRCHKLAHHSH